MSKKLPTKETVKFGKNLLSYMNKKKLSQSELSRQIGLSGGHLYKIMHGQFNPALPTIVKILKVTKIKFEKMAEL